MGRDNNEKWQDHFPEELVKYMAQGRSYITWGVTQDPMIGKSTLYNWEKKYPEWKAAKERGYAAGMKFFEDLLISNTMGILPESLIKRGSTGINAGNVLFALRTRFYKEYGESSKVLHGNTEGDDEAKEFKISFVKPKKKETVAEKMERVKGEK